MINPMAILAWKDKRGNLSDLARLVGRLLWMVPVITLVCVVLILGIGHGRLSEAGGVFIGSLIYCVLIATPCMVVIPFLSERCKVQLSRVVILIDAAALLVIATIGTFAGAYLIEAIGIIRPGQYWIEFRRSYPISVIISLGVGLSMTSIEMLRYKLQAATLELRARQVEQERANKLLAEARLSSLESRIHPHFLFNTLNSISALIPANPQLAEDTVGNLASLLRFSLGANHGGVVPLSQELKISKDYLEIERTRFGARLRYNFAVTGEALKANIPPLAVQSLVENCIKHVVAQRAEGASIEVSAAIANGRVHVAVADDGPGFSLSSITPEHGLGNLISRLDLLFGDQGKLDVVRENDKNIVTLSFPVG